MNSRITVLAALALLISVGGYMVYRDYEYRQIHGSVVEVGLLNWEQEVETVKDSQPVLIYFYKENEQNPVDEKQKQEVANFAWRNAGKVKVVAINCAHLENLPLVIAYGRLRQPSFTILSGARVVDGAAGTFTTSAELSRLLQQLNRK